MSLTAHIIEKRELILRRWFEDVLESYPKQSRVLIARGTDRFSNPIGFSLDEGLKDIFSALVGEKEVAEVEPALGQIIKLRAIQEKREGNELAFLFALKGIIRDVCGAYKRKFSAVKELLELEDRVDLIILMGQEIYVRSREKILELQVNEMKNKTHMFRRLVGEQ